MMTERIEMKGARDKHGFQRQIRWGFAGSLLATMMIATLSVLAILSIRQSKNAVLFAQGQDLLIAKDLLTLFESRSAGGRAYLLTGDHEFIQKRQEERRRFLEKMALLNQRTTLAEGRDLLNRIERTEAEYEAVSRDIIGLRSSDQPASSVIDLFEAKGRPIRERLRTDLDSLVAYEQRTFDFAREESARSTDRILVLFVTLATFAIILAGALGVILSKTLSRAYRRSEEALESLERSEALTGRIVEAALDCIISMDSQGRIIDFNPAAEKVFGYDSREVIGKEMAEVVIPPRFRDAHRKGLAHYLATGEGPIMDQRLEFSAVRRNGSEFPVELTVTRTRFNGEPLFTGFIRDITERKRIEDERLRAIQARDELVAVVSHELKNPLTAIATSSELILRALPASKQDSITRKSLEKIRSSIHRMSRLTSDLLDITKVEAGSLQLDRSSQSVAELVSEALDAVQSSAAEKKIFLEKKLPAEILFAFCDRDRIIQVLVNLIGNAVKFSPEGSEILVEAIATGDNIEITVKDNGPGIPEEQLPKIFDRFWQAKQTAFKGTGLGLPISKGIVEAHGGKISVESRIGSGSAFHFTLKKADQAVQPASAAS